LNCDVADVKANVSDKLNATWTDEWSTDGAACGLKSAAVEIDEYDTRWYCIFTCALKLTEEPA